MVGKDPYNLPQNTERGVDQLTYNPRAAAEPDNAEYNPDKDDELQPIGARGADNQPTFRNAAKEDQEAEYSESTGRIPQSTSPSNFRLHLC
jgi:hypothetical protein